MGIVVVMGISINLNCCSTNFMVFQTLCQLNYFISLFSDQKTSRDNI